MGWAKYYEDNVSICIGRMAIKDSIPVRKKSVRNYNLSINHKRENPAKPVIDHKIVKVRKSFEQPMGNGRRGLELFFTTMPEMSFCRKLQMNGWWWSAAKQCWCNLNTKGNLKYAEGLNSNYEIKQIIVIPQSLKISIVRRYE